MRMRLCVASNNPHRLQNQCVYCHNKKFQQTVRICTGTVSWTLSPIPVPHSHSQIDTPVQPYLPANVSLEEGFCMVRQCRAQMPLLRPEPFYVGPELGDAVGVNVDAIAATDDISYGPANSHGYSNPPTSQAYNGYNTIPAPMISKPLRRRPPAHIYVGRPLRPGNVHDPV
jgi:hypothetical protein